ncbi:hypothetical protein [Shewanella sp. MEBiC00475]|nr:hypothetical protein [Shewanella sp. MEBiC00475]
MNTFSTKQGVVKLSAPFFTLMHDQQQGSLMVNNYWPLQHI